MNTVGIIPARYESSRFPGKPLVDLGGKPMIQWVWERARRARTLNRVIIATDDKRIAEAVKKFGGEVAMTRRNHPSGTDRIAEVARELPAQIIVNIQGDEPLIHPDTIDEAVKALRGQHEFGMSTLCSRIENSIDIEARHVVKVVTRFGGEALYFSRSPIPCNRDGESGVQHFRHIGLYAYFREVLLDLVKKPVSSLEKAEKLEQLRALQNGVRILVKETKHASIGVDTPEDLEQIKKQLKL